EGLWLEQLHEGVDTTSTNLHMDACLHHRVRNTRNRENWCSIKSPLFERIRRYRHQHFLLALASVLFTRDPLVGLTALLLVHEAACAVVALHPLASLRVHHLRAPVNGPSAKVFTGVLRHHRLPRVEKGHYEPHDMVILFLKSATYSVFARVAET